MNLSVFLSSISVIRAGGGSNFFMLLYLGPDTIMPLASVIAAVLGFLLIFWRTILTFFKKAIRKITGKGPGVPDADLARMDTADETKDEVSSL